MRPCCWPHRLFRHLARKGGLKGEDESGSLSDCAGCDDGMGALRMSSVTYCIVTGAQAGRKVATLQTIAADNGSPEGGAGTVGGFSLHAGVAAEAHEGQKLERLCRYIARPDTKLRAQLTPSGRGKRPPSNVADDEPPEPADNRTPI